MSLSGLEPVAEKLITPAIEVASGRATVEQVHENYKGLQLLCPHCTEEWRRRLGSDDVAEMLLNRGEETPLSSRLYPKKRLEELRQELDRVGLLETMKAGVQAFPENLRVRFRQGHLRSGEVARWMHWSHLAKRPEGSPKLPCHDPGCITHAVAVGSIQLALEEEYKSRSDIQIVREKDLIVVPGEPPLKRRPDLVVHEKGSIIRIIEIQRSIISKEDFMERTEHLQSFCSAVEWIFFKSAYNRMQVQRQWLTDMGFSYHYLFLEGFKLKVEEGTPPVPKRVKTSRKSVKSNCRFDDPNESTQAKPQVAETNLPLDLVGSAIFSNSASSNKPLPPTRRTENTVRTSRPLKWGYFMGDSVEVWVNGKWLQGSVSSTYTDTGDLSVELKRINRRRRFIKISDQHLIKRFESEQQQPQPKLHVEKQQPEQLNLFFDD